jgi:hypothetical protein
MHRESRSSANKQKKTAAVKDKREKALVEAAACAYGP